MKAAKQKKRVAQKLSSSRIDLDDLPDKLADGTKNPQSIDGELHSSHPNCEYLNATLDRLISITSYALFALSDTDSRVMAKQRVLKGSIVLDCDCSASECSTFHLVLMAGDAILHAASSGEPSAFCTVWWKGESVYQFANHKNEGRYFHGPIDGSSWEGSVSRVNDALNGYLLVE